MLERFFSLNKDNQKHHFYSQKHKKCISKRQHIDCKQDGQNPCRGLNHLFLCKDGLCQNITSAFDCKYDKFETSSEQMNVNDEHCVRCDCKEKRNCITLNGLYDCKNGVCSKVRFSLDTTTYINVYTLSYFVG